MRTQFSNKALTPEATKLSPAQQAVYDRNTANLGLNADDANEVGRAVALAAEEASISPASRLVRDRMRQAAEPSTADAAELADALAAYDILLAKRETARAACFRAERDLHDALNEGASWDTADPDAAAKTARAQSKLAAAEHALDLASVELDFVTGRIGRARGAIGANGAARQREYVSRGI